MLPPPNYPQLSAVEKKEVRVAIVSSTQTPQDVVEGWEFFTAYYLDRLPGGKQLEARFFYKKRMVTPGFHREMIRDMTEHTFCVTAAPRGSAKSTVLKSRAIQLLCTAPLNFTILVVQANDLQVRKWLDDCMFQIQYNPRIREDFGDLKPSRGDGMWSRHVFTTSVNRRRLMGLSVGAKMLGERPDLIIMDDPEHDPDATTTGTKDVKKMGKQLQTLLYNTILPFLDTGAETEVEEGELKPSFYWIGTLLHRGACIYRFLKGEDKRTRFWRKRLHTIVEVDAEGVLSLDNHKGKLLWPQKWGWPQIDKWREFYGESRFSSSYMNDPVADEDLALKLHPKYGYYHIETEGPAVCNHDDPLNMIGSLHWIKTHRTKGNRLAEEKRVEPVGEFFSRMWRFLTVDYAFTISADSDWSGVLVQGFDNTGVLWPLDLWMGKVSSDVLVEKMWEMGRKWKVAICGIEAAGIQSQLVDRAQTDLQERAITDGWQPRVVPITYPRTLNKMERIAGVLEWRFTQYRIRMPQDMQGVGDWRQLYSQIANFSIDGHRLDHDDALDLLHMHKYLKGLRTGLGKTRKETRVHKSPLDHILDGELYSEAGIPYLHGINASELTDEAESVMIKVQVEAQEEKDDGIYWN